MSSRYLSPSEMVILNSHGSIEKPVKGHGQLYLTDKRLVLVHRSGLIKIKETPVLDIEIPQISYSKIEGTIRRALVLGVKAGNGQVVAYRIRVAHEEKWHSEINTLKGGKNESDAPEFPKTERVSDSIDEAAYCGQCGKKTLDSNFCPNCGEPQVHEEIAKATQITIKRTQNPKSSS